MYEVKTLKLDNAVNSDQELVKAGRRIAELFVLDMPAGASFKLKVGNNADYITISRPFSMEPQGNQEANEGLYWINPNGQPGVSVELCIVYGNDQLNTVLT